MNENNHKKSKKTSSQQGEKSFSRLEQDPFGAGLKKSTSFQREQKKRVCFSGEKNKGYKQTAEGEHSFVSQNIDFASLKKITQEVLSEGELVFERETQEFQLGIYQSLRIVRLAPPGAYLDGGSEEILLPNRYLPKECVVDSFVEVFVYHDNEGRLVATTLKPLAQVGEVAFLKVNMVTNHGAFLDWGIHRDLFVPFSEQREKMQEGYSYPVVVYIDHVSGRIVGSSKLSKHIAQQLPDFEPGEAVDILFVEAISVGYRAVVNNHYWGLVYNSDLDRAVHLGERTTAYVIRVREDDRLDLSLTPLGMERLEEGAQKLLSLLRNRGGELPIGDKSSPEEIERLTGYSKKVFKRSVGILYKQRLVAIESFKLKLL
ncbi:CvfB family protein [Porphyromonas gingivicanis]|uniref:CvfB family protein n=1 Tax=Porphyromonas gingivicanis TaxID=266762 RepID=UPI000470B198|nr:S1-like domain-containing RNA-binding protein [Porphyromonas gingivicanis]